MVILSAHNCCVFFICSAVITDGCAVTAAVEESVSVAAVSVAAVSVAAVSVAAVSAAAVSVAAVLLCAGQHI